MAIRPIIIIIMLLLGLLHNYTRKNTPADKSLSAKPQKARVYNSHNVLHIAMVCNPIQFMYMQPALLLLLDKFI